MGRARSSSANTAAPASRRAAPVALPDTSPDTDWAQLDPAVLLEAAQVARELHVSELVAARLVMNGMDARAISAYLHPGPQHIQAPDVTVPGMSAAAADLSAAVDRGETIAIYGDYDVDGHTSLAIVADALQGHGATVHSASASAASGFGLNREFVEQARAAGATWLLTVDCGSTQTEPVKLAQSLGMGVIVVDHHDVDPANPAEHHLNPRMRAARAAQDIAQALHAAGGPRVRTDPPYDSVLSKLSDGHRELLGEQLGAGELARLQGEVRAGAHPTNTGSMLAWKLAAALHVTRQGSTPAAHYGRPLYLAGLGAIADMAPCDDPEVRAMVRVPVNAELQRDRFANADTVPPGVRMLAGALGEDAERADQLVRTRALLNLSKRTGEVDPADIQTVIRSDDPEQLAALIPRLVRDYERLSAIRRDRMDPDAMAAIQAAREQGQDGYFNTPALRGYEQYSGYARMVANNAAGQTGRPTIAFVRRGVDEFGQELWKFSGANDCVRGAHLGELIHRDDMAAACTIRARDWLGAETDIANLGGHAEVVSGVCTTQNIPRVRAAAEAWAAELDARKQWQPASGGRPRVARRNLTAAQFARVEQDARLLAPLGFPAQPSVQVSVRGALEAVRLDGDRQAWTARLRLPDGSARDVLLSDEVAAVARAHPRQHFEALIALGASAPYYVGTVAVA